MWLELPRDIRDHLTTVFGIVKTGIAEIRDQTVISDGVTNDNLAVISAEKMEEYVGSKEEFHKLWQLTVSKAKFELHPPIDIMDLADLGFKEVSNEEFAALPAVPSLEKSFEVLKEIQTAIQTEAQTTELNAMNIVPLKFCNTCDSKGGRHLKVCPKFK